MDIARAFTFVFEDREWTPKLLISAGIALAAVILMPLLFVGLVAVALLLGYLVELIRNVRDAHPSPLPRWDQYAEKLSTGGNILAALIVYNLVNIIPLCCYLTTSSFWRDGFVGSAIGLVVLCCIVPFVLIYNIITWPMLALGLARYADEGNIGVFFQFGDLFRTVFGRWDVTIQWIFLSFLINIAFTLVFAIPCVGWAAAPAFFMPVHGYLVAQFADRVEDSPRLIKKKKRSA